VKGTRIVLAPYVLIAPAQLLVIALILVPALYVLFLSFHTSSFGQEPIFVGLQNYFTVLSDDYFWRALTNTVIVILIVVHAEILIGLGMALLLSSWTWWRPAILAIILAPYAVTEASAVVIWRFLFEPQMGAVGQALTALGLPTLEWAVEPMHGLIMVALLSVWLHLPFTFIILYAARLAIPTDLYEAGAIDGATPWQQFRRLTLPLLLPAMLIAMLFRYIFAFRLFSEVWLLTGGGPARTTEVSAVYLYLEAFRYHSFGTASATGWLLVLASFGLAYVYLRSIYREMFRGQA
jgi:multiple sugar transport system permease protein